MAVKKSKGHSKVLDALLLDVGLLDLGWEPSRSVLRLIDHCGRADETMHFVCAALAQTNVSVTGRSGLQSVAARLLAHENLGRIIITLHQNEVFLARH